MLKGSNSGKRAADTPIDEIFDSENPAKKLKTRVVPTPKAASNQTQQVASIFTLSNDLLTSSILGLANNPLTALVCRQFQTLWDKVKESRFNNDRAPESRFLINDAGKNPVLEMQQKEVNYLLQHKIEILDEYNCLELMLACFEGLEKYQSIESNDNHKFLVREKILNSLNKVIIKNRIQASKTGEDPKFLDCSYRFLTRFPGEMITSLEYIDYFRALQKLHLNNNFLIQLPPEIGHLRALTELQINSNQLTALPREFCQLMALQNLFFSNNLLSEFPRELVQLKVLRSLCIDNNQLTQLPAEIGQLRALQYLNVSHNNLKLLPAEIGQLIEVYLLGLENNHLMELPSEIRLLRELINLRVNNNDLIQLPAELGQLTKLKVLDLFMNQITHLPSEIGQLRELWKLNLYSNRLMELPSEIGKLTALQVLTLEHNDLTQLPAEIGQLPALKWLNLDKNHLTFLPESLREDTLYELVGSITVRITKAKVLSSQRPLTPVLTERDSYGSTPRP